MIINVYLNTMKQAEPPGFWFWFATEAVFAVIVVLLLYIFFVRNPKINKNYENRNRPDRNSKTNSTLP